MKIQTKTTILYTVLFASLLVILEGVVYYFINMAAQNDFNKRVELRAKISAKFRFEKNRFSTEAFQEIQREYLEKLSQEKAFVFSADSARLKLPSLTPEGIDMSYINSIISAGGATVHRQVRFRHFAGLLYKRENGDYIIIKSAINQYGMELMKQIRTIMVITVLVSLLISYLAGRYVASLVIRPFRQMITKVQQINVNNLDVRLNTPRGNDEIAELTGTFNEMLDRIQTAFETQHNFISLASHELRTPLTAITAEAEYALSKDRSLEEYTQSLRHITIQAGKLQHLTQGLLNLAQTGFDGKKIQWEKIRIDELVYEAKSNADAITGGKQIQITVTNFPEEEDLLYVSGNADLLKLAVSNILLNACKYSGQKTVQLELTFNAGTAVIIITDKGIGIPAAEIKNIYDPFFRASNTRGFEGFGIGMPLTRNIIRLHKGTIDVSSVENTGTKVTIEIPLLQTLESL